MAISLDGPDAASHDGFRGVGGTFATGMRALRHAREIGLDTQIQATVMRGNMNRLGAIAELTAEVRTRRWSLFFLVAPFEVKTTEAMHSRRFLSQRAHGGENGGHNGFRTAGVSEGRGFVFVSHTGEIYPSGFLPISAGNVRTSSLTTVYRDSGLFRVLRDPLRREGKCGLCEFVKICGGARARAYALTGNYLGEDPRCVYEPVGQETLVAC